MKKLSQKIFALGLLTMLISGQNLAFAASNPANFMPQNPLFYFELNTTKDHPLQGQLQSALDKMMTEKNDIAKQLLAKAIDQTTIGFAQTQHLADQSDIYMLAFAINENDFNQIIANATPEQLKTSDLGMGRKIYTDNADFFFTYKDGNLVASNIEGLISDVLMVSNPKSLAQNPDFQQFLTQADTNSFFKGYIDYQKYFAHFSPDLNLSELTKLIQTEGFSFKQSPQSLDGKIYLKYTADSATNLQKFAFTPELYQKVSAKNLLMYQESNDWVNHLNLLSNSLLKMPEFTDSLGEISKGFTEVTGLNFDTDIAPLMRAKTAISIHTDLDNQYYPTISFITQVKGNEGLANTTLNKLDKTLEDQISKTIQESYQNSLDMQKYYTDNYPNTANPYKDLLTVDQLKAKALIKQTVSVGGNTFQEITFDPDYNSTNSSTQSDLGINVPTPSKLKLHLSWGVTTDGLLVITTLSNPALLFDNGGLSADSGFKSNYSGQSVADLSYINLDNIQSYTKSLMTEFKAAQSTIDDVTKFMGPLHSFFVSTSVQDLTYTASLRLTADLSKFSVYQDLLGSITNIANPDQYNYNNTPLSAQSPFSDVKDADWYSYYVKYVNDNGLMTGYEDGSFQPNKPITRAEFVKTLVTQLQNQSDWQEKDNTQQFSDVSDQDWFSYYVNQARSHGIVNGFNDNTFRPNQPINRAEAMQIVFNSNANLKSTGTTSIKTPFRDVNSSDWFYQAVSSAEFNAIVDGKTPNEFKPNDQLTRAETAKIIDRLSGDGKN